MKSSDHVFEHRLQATLHDVPMPGGLHDRLLAAVAGVPLATGAPLTIGAPVGPAEQCPAVVASVSTAPAPRRRRISRRSLLAGAMAASVLLGGVGWWQLRPAVDFRPDIATLAASWFPRLANTWKPMASAPHGFAAPSALRNSPKGWQPAAKFVGHPAVAFDVSRPGLRAALFVVRMTSPQLPFGPPGSPQGATGGQAIAAWRGAGVVYVLVVEGDEQGYRSLIRSAGAPLA